jgi:hypothetical protein
MSNPQSNPIANDTMAEFERAIAAAAEGIAPRPFPVAGAGVNHGAPDPRRRTSPIGNEAHLQSITSPIQLLASVADHAQKLHQQALELVGAVTGEAPPPMRLRAAPRPGGGLLPHIALLAHEIETVHVEIARLFEHVRGRL